jgi:hypothetical protein
MVSEEARARARTAIERRLVRERAFFLGALAAFLTALVLDLNGAGAFDPLLFVLIVVAGLTGAGYDGAREALKDLDLLAGFLESLGPDATLEPVPFFTRGHYELWFTQPSALGARRLGISFANSLLAPARKSRYLLMVPLPPGVHDKEPSPPRKPVTETGTGGLLEGRTIDYYLWSPRRGGPKQWRVLVFLQPGRPLDVMALRELATKGQSLATKIAAEGAQAVPWGSSERFERPRAEDIPPDSQVILGGDRV